MTDANALDRHNRRVYEAAARRRDEIVSVHESRGARFGVTDPLRGLRDAVRDTLREASGRPDLEPTLDVIDRSRFGADLVVKFPSLLAAGGPKVFVEEHLQWILDALRSPALGYALEAVESVGMYVNLRLRDAWLLEAARAAVEAGEAYGASTALADGRYVVDYSSPNVAKTLHAGHIRSTIIGDVLSNVLEAAGGLVFRVNHINDFGGFGFLLEGHRRFDRFFAPQASLNERSLQLYRLRRVLEGAVVDGASLDDLSEADADLLRNVMPGVESPESLAEAFQELTEAADRRFADLEAGLTAEVELWQDIVAASMEDFSSFYDSLRISIDFVLGESLYAVTGLTLVQEWLAAGRAIVYDDAAAAADLEELRAQVAAAALSEAELESARQGMRKDLGAVVVRLSPVERFVILRRDGRSIYATRDLAAVFVREQLFQPTACIYVVGQEQRTHFERLFATSYQLGLADRARTTFEHLYFGFYVDAHTHKKLSSRESATGVAQLIESAQEYFKARAGERQAAEDVDDVANQLTVASIVFNDLKQDIRSSVDMDTKDMASTVEAFEKAGGAYVIYAACRAGSIVRKAAEAADTLPAIEGGSLDTGEVALLLQVLGFPGVVTAAAEQRNVSLVVRHLLNLSNQYNSYYAKARVITEDGIITSRLLTSAATERTLRNGLSLCNVDCPDSI